MSIKGAMTSLMHSKKLDLQPLYLSVVLKLPLKVNYTAGV